MKRSVSMAVGVALIGIAAAQSFAMRNDRPLAAAVSLSAPHTKGKKKTQSVRNFSRLPLAFESNQGQTDPRVRFLTHSLDRTLFLTSTEAVFLLSTHPDRRHASKNPLLKDLQIHRPDRNNKSDTVRMQLIGSNTRASVIQEQPLADRVNYFIGNDPRKWHSAVPTFGRVGFHEVYPGIDLVYYGNQRRLEYDFVVAPRADPKRIQLHFAGAQGVHLNAAGDLIVGTPEGALTWRKPTVYQRSAAGTPTVVAARFRLNSLPDGKTGVRFALGHYDTSRPLVIDPVLVYATYLGGSGGQGGDFASGIAIDAAGSAYITGYTGSLDFPTTVSAYQRVSRSGVGNNVFVTKLNPTGDRLIYSTYLGGSAYDNANAIAVDSAGNAYITGRAFSPDFPTTPGAFQRVNKANHNAFVTKLNPGGSSLVYSTYLGGSGSDSGVGIAVDAGGHAFVTGHTVSSDFPTTAGAFQAVNRSPAGGNAFVTELDPVGSTLVYSTYLGGSGVQGDSGESIAVDGNSNAYITGDASSPDFPTSPGAYQRVEKALNNSNAFVTKLNTTGTTLVYSTYLGGSVVENGNSIAVDGSGQAYVAGNTLSLDFPTTSGAFQRVLRTPATASAFVTKLNADGTALVYSTYLGGSAGTYTYHLAIDNRSDAYVAGYTDALDFPTTVGAYRRSGVGATVGRAHSFVTHLNASGSALVYSTYLGGTGGDYASAIAVDSSGDAYVTGYTGSADFPVTSGALQTAKKAIAASAYSAFVAKLSTIPVFPDFNNDGFTDLLIQNSATGVMASWLLQGATYFNGAYFSYTPPPTFALLGDGDFSGDGNISLVLQDSVTNKVALYYTAGTNHATITGGDFLNVTPGVGWKVVGIGDFNNDGKSDIVFQNQTTHQISIWYMNGRFYTGGAVLPYVPDPAWKVVGVGDFNGDGFADLALQNQTTNQICTWFFNGTTYLGGVLMPNMPGVGWKVVGVGDYNGDGFADLLFQNQANNQPSVWYLQNGYLTGTNNFSVSLPSGWKITGPR